MKGLNERELVLVPGSGYQEHRSVQTEPDLFLLLRCSLVGVEELKERLDAMKQDTCKATLKGAFLASAQ